MLFRDTLSAVSIVCGVRAGAARQPSLTCRDASCHRLDPAGSGRVIRFFPAPTSAEIPQRFPSPFDRAAVHPLARRAATELIELLQSSAAAAWGLHEAGGGKMFGVLVVAAPDGTLGWLRGFSGMLAGQWVLEGWAPPAFDILARDAIWIPGEAEMLDRKSVV